MRIVHSDLSGIKFCNRGARQFFQRHGLDWSEFIKNGIDASKVEHIDDAMMRQVIQRATDRASKGAS